MKRRHPLQIASITLMLCAMTISLLLVASKIPASHGRNGLLTLNWFAWLLFVVFYPFGVIQSGTVTGLNPPSVSHRNSSPARFWTGLVATTLFWISVFAVISLWSFMAWYRVA